MDIVPYLLDTLKYFIAGMGVVSATYYMLKPHLDRSDQIQLLEFQKNISNQTLPLRLHAYERVVLYVERINPASILLRLNAGSYSARELHTIVIEEIRNEYQHNIAQQVYVSSRAWGMLRRVKDDTISIITNAVKGLPDDATGLELSRTVLMHISTLEENPYDVALSVIKKDMEKLF